MMTAATAQSFSATNPLFNDSPLKLGSFSTNLSGGGTISKMEGLLKAEWPATLELARLADEMKFEAIVPVGRWKGFGGETNFNGEGFEVFVWAAGLSDLERASFERLCDLAHPDRPSAVCRQASRSDRSHRQRPLYAQSCDRLVYAGNGDVRHHAPRP